MGVVSGVLFLNNDGKMKAIEISYNPMLNVNL